MAFVALEDVPPPARGSAGGGDERDGRRRGFAASLPDPVPAAGFFFPEGLSVVFLVVPMAYRPCRTTSSTTARTMACNSSADSLRLAAAEVGAPPTRASAGAALMG